MKYLNYKKKDNDIMLLKYAIKVYKYPLNERSLIRSENNGKIGVYAWVNTLNNKFYIGSNSVYLILSDYYQNLYKLSLDNLSIVRDLSKYGMVRFYLVILNYTDSKSILSCEQKWIDHLKPEYNINPIVDSTKGYKHSV
jgi:group I intron endonuclease